LSKVYDYIVIGGGICGCSFSYFLSQYNNNILLIDKNKIASGGSGAAGAFLSPLLGKDNYFKSLVNKALIFSTSFYKNNFNKDFDNCGVLRIPKDDIDKDKFLSYEDYMDFEYSSKQINKDSGYFFDIGSVVNSQNICNNLVKNINKKLNYEVKDLKFQDELWIINNELKAKNIILSTGFESLLNEEYINIRPVWGQRLDIKTNFNLDFSIHKNHSISKNKNGIISIGATHHTGLSNLEVTNEDNQKLIDMTKEIIDLEDFEIINTFGGTRSCSVDYIPIIGEVIDSRQTMQKYSYVKNGTKVPVNLLPKYKNLYMINGVGGRGFVLGPYIANLLVENIINQKEFDEKIQPNRLFYKWVRKQK
jgi:tRNA 5-methylaminomethyl-2-thiouridine biosynthesis bifunctional protein